MNFVLRACMMRFIKRFEDEVDAVAKKNALLAQQNKHLAGLLRQTELLASARLGPRVDPATGET